MEKVRLGDVFEEQITGEWGSECEGNESGVKVLRTTNFSLTGDIDFSSVVERNIPEKKIDKKRLYQGDIILEKSGGTDKTPVGRVVYCGPEVDEDIYLCNNFTQAMRVNGRIADPKYVFYFMWYLHQIGKTDLLQNKTTGIRNLQVKAYLDQKIVLPEMQTQKQESAILDKIKELIEKRKQQLEKLDLLVKSQFIEMFGDPETNSLCWEHGTIKDIVSDVRYGSSRKAVENGKYPYLRMNNITYEGELDLTDTKKINIPDNELDKCSVRRGDVLFNRTNSKELVGKTCLYDRDELMVLAGFVIRVRVNERAIPEFLVAYMNLPQTKKLLLSMCRAACGQANINATEFQGIPIYIPSIELQKQFAAFKQQADKSKFAIQQSINKLETLKKALMQKYFG